MIKYKRQENEKVVTFWLFKPKLNSMPHRSWNIFSHLRRTKKILAAMLINNFKLHKIKKKKNIFIHFPNNLT